MHIDHIDGLPTINLAKRKCKCRTPNNLDAVKSRPAEERDDYEHHKKPELQRCCSQAKSFASQSSSTICTNSDGGEMIRRACEQMTSSKQRVRHVKLNANLEQIMTNTIIVKRVCGRWACKQDATEVPEHKSNPVFRFATATRGCSSLGIAPDGYVTPAVHLPTKTEQAKTKTSALMACYEAASPTTRNVVLMGLNGDERKPVSSPLCSSRVSSSTTGGYIKATESNAVSSRR